MLRKVVLLFLISGFLTCYAKPVANKKTNNKSSGSYYVQIYALNQLKLAQNELNKIKKAHKTSGIVRSVVINNKTFYQVQLGPYLRLADAKRVKQTFKTGMIRHYDATGKTVATSVVATAPKQLPKPPQKSSTSSPKGNPNNPYSLPIISYPAHKIDDYTLEEGQKLQVIFDI